jgi:hypothetical protein
MLTTTRAEEAFLQFAKLMVARLPIGHPRTPFPVSQRQRRKFLAEDNWEWESHDDFDIRKVWELYSISELERESPELRFAIQTHYRDGLVPMPRFGGDDQKNPQEIEDSRLASPLINTLTWPLWHAGLEDDSLKPSESTLIKAHRQYFGQAYKSVVYLPIQGLQSIPDFLHRIGDLEFVRATPEWKTQYQQVFEYGHFTRAGIEELSSIRWLARYECTPHGGSKLSSQLRDLLTALRIVTSFPIGAPVVIDESLAPKPRTVGMGWGPTYEFALAGYRTNIDLDIQRAQQALEIYNLLQRLRTDDKLSELAFAIRRYNMAFGRELDEDAFVDLVISVESLILQQSGELSYRLQVRGVALLAEEGNKLDIPAILKNAYNIRSRIVHGDFSGNHTEPGYSDLMKHLKKQGIANLGEAVKQQREVTGSIIAAVVRALTNYENLKSFLDALDQSILNGIGKPRKCD